MPRVWMVAYDISDDKHRRAVEKILSGFGKRVQNSIFECQFKFDDLKGIQSKMDELIVEESDSIRYYPVCTHCQEGTLFEGKGELPAPINSYLIL